MADAASTVSRFFFADAQDAGAKLAQASAGDEVMFEVKRRLAGVPGLEWSTVASSIGAELYEALDIGLDQILIPAWHHYEPLCRALAPDRLPRHQFHLLPLAEHTVRTVHQPSVELLVSDRALARFRFDVDLALTLHGAILNVRGGLIREISAGTCRGRGALSCGGVTLVEADRHPFALAGVIDFGEGVELRIPGAA